MIRVIDFGGEKVADQIQRAFEEAGVLQIVNHGIPLEVFDSVMREAKVFFHQSEEEKNRVSYRAPVPRGYSGCSKENFACLAGERRPNDLVEKFRVGPFDLPSDPDHPDYFYYHQDDRAKALFYPNKWPQELPTFQTELENYYHHLESLARVLIDCFEQCLKVPTGTLSEKLDRHTSILSVNRYPPLSGIKQVQPGQLRLAQHTDVDLFTIVYHDDRFGGLQVQLDQEWIAVPHVPGALVVNIGDGLNYWTRGKWKSTVHRVCLPIEQEMNRYSIGYFVGANYDALLTPLEAAATDEKEFPVVTYSEWRKRRIRRAMNALKNK